MSYSLIIVYLQINLVRHRAIGIGGQGQLQQNPLQVNTTALKLHCGTVAEFFTTCIFLISVFSSVCKSEMQIQIT